MIISDPDIKRGFDEAWKMSNAGTANVREYGGIVAYDDDTHRYLIPEFIEGIDAGSGRFTSRAREWISRTEPTLGQSHNIGFAFYFHTHPNRMGSPAPGGRIWGNPDKASGADVRNFAGFKRTGTGTQFAPFAIIVSEKRIVAYDASNSQLCTFNR
jgi:hypothetical protein